MTIGLNYIDGELCPGHPDIFNDTICIPESTAEEISDAFSSAVKYCREIGYGMAILALELDVNKVKELLAEGHAVVWKPNIHQVAQANHFVKSILHPEKVPINIIYGSNRTESLLRSKNFDCVISNSFFS